MDLVDYINRHRRWSETTFKSGARTGGLVAHILKECEEILAKPDDLEEWIDVIILAIDGAWRSGHTAEEISGMLELKLHKNQQRRWKVTEDPNVPNEHVRTDEEETRL